VLRKVAQGGIVRESQKSGAQDWHGQPDHSPTGGRFRALRMWGIASGRSLAQMQPFFHPFFTVCVANHYSKQAILFKQSEYKSRMLRDPERLGEIPLVSHCSNPDCMKPLHYLREGKIYVFDLPDPAAPISGNGNSVHRMEHFWLCGPCSELFVLEQTGCGVGIARKMSRVLAS
jgi:hypothetical protein